MGGIAEKMLAARRRACGRRPPLGGVIAADVASTCCRREIEEQAILMIARRQPMAVDLREIISRCAISTDLERIGDLGQEHRQARPGHRGPVQPKQIVPACST